MYYMLMTFWPLYSGKGLYESHDELLKRLNLIMDLSEGYYEKWNRLDIWDAYLKSSEPRGVVVIVFNKLFHKDKCLVKGKTQLKEPYLPPIHEDTDEEMSCDSPGWKATISLGSTIG